MTSKDEMEGFEEELSVLLESEDSTNLEAATIEKVISLLWKAPILQSAALKILTNACLQEFQKQTQNTGYAIITLVSDNITQLLDHRTSSWAAVIFQWGVSLLTAMSKMKFKSELSLEMSLKNWLGIAVIQVISNIVTRCLTNLLPDNARSCVQSLMELTKDESVHVRWIIFYVISKNPSLMVPHIIEVAVDFHQCTEDGNSLVINLAHCLSHLARFHRDTVKKSLTKFIMALFDLTDQLELRRNVDFLFWLVKSDTTMFCLAASDTLQQITVANIRALLGVYYGLKKADSTSKVAMKTEQASASEDEGEVISSDDENDGDNDGDDDDNDEGTPKVEPLKPSIVKEEKEEIKQINNNTDYTPVLVELICNLGNSVAMVAVKLLIDSAQLMGIPTKCNQTEEAMEEGEVDEVPFTEGHLNEAARALNLLLMRIQEVAFTKLYPAAKGTGAVAEEVIHFVAALQSNGKELCNILLLAGSGGLIQYWLYQLLVFVGQISSEMHAAQLIGYLLLKCDSNDKLSVVINMFHEMSAVHSRLANTTLQCTLTQLLPDTPGDLTTLTRNVLALVQLPKSSAKQLQVRAYFLEAIKEHIQVLSRLLVENVMHGGSNTTMATGKLLLLMATAVNDKPRKHRQSLTERINIARNLLNCYFELIKLDSDSDMRHDTWLTSCSDVISSLLLQQQDGLANFLFSALLKTVLSPEMRNYFGATIRLPKANIVRGSINNLPSPVTVHNLNHMIHLLSSCCLANTSHYLQVSKVMMDQVAPSVVPDHVAWPTREHFKYYMEINLSIKRHFDENPVLWSLLQLLAADPAAILWCSGLLCALMCVLINHWVNMKNPSIQETPIELKSSCNLAKILAKAEWLHPSMLHISEVFYLLSPPEMFQLMNAIYNHVKLHLAVAQDTVSLEENLQQYTTTLKTALRTHVVKLGPLFARYYPRGTESKPNS